jgi:rod shape-determining protein MreC
MNSSSPGFTRTIIFGLVVAGLLLLSLGGYLNPIFRLTTNPLVTVQSWFSTRYMALFEFFTVPRDIASLRERNAELEAENSRLQTQIIVLQQQISEAQVLYGLLNFERQQPENQYVAASVIGRDPNPFMGYIIIKAGSDQGIRRGMPVVTEQGLVGRISTVSASASLVQLITDPSSAVNVRLSSSQTEAILSGSVTGDVILDLVPQDITIQPGELVLTSGLGGNYPPNIVIGQVLNVRRQENELFQGASVQTVVDFSQLQVILVITNFQPVDINPLIQPTPEP